MRVDSYGLEAFLAIVRYGTLSRAANELRISQSAMSQRIRALEETLNVKLIDRGRGRAIITLTTAGESLLPMAERWDMLRADLQHAAFANVHSISVGASPSVNDFVLAPLYRELSVRDTKLRINVHTANSPELYQRLQRRELDVAFVLHAQRLPGLTIRPVLRETLVLVSNTEFPIADQGLDLHVLEPRDQVYLDYGPDYEAWHVGWFGSTNAYAVHVDDIHMVAPFLSGKGRWAIVPKLVAQAFKERHGTRIYELKDPPPDRILFRARLRTMNEPNEAGCRLLEELIQKLAKASRLADGSRKAER